MSARLSAQRELAGWLGAATVAAALFAGAAAAALRAPPGPMGQGPEEAVALDLSVGVVPLSAVLPSEPPQGAAMVAPEMAQAPKVDAAPDVLPVTPERAGDAVMAPRIDMPTPALNLPKADTAPVMTAAPPPLPEEDPPLDLAQSPRPVARPERAKPEVRQAEAPRPAETAPQAEPTQDPAPRAEAQAAQPAGSEQAARPAQERRVAGGQEAARYGDRVMRQIARLRRQKAPERGAVTVGFEIAGDGGLRRVSVVSSSGSAALDQVAVDHIRRAAPFPPPPEGATTRFAFEFVGK